MDESAFVEKMTSDDNVGALQTFWINKGQLLYYFGDYDGSFHYDLGGAWNVNERFAVTVGFEKREVGDTSPSVKLEQIYVGGRLNF